jgi:hypothetical protein
VDHSELANRWIALQHADSAALNYDEHIHAYDEVDSLLDSDPAAGWDFVMTVLTRAEGDFILGNLAAGPVEDLLMRHPNITVERIERDVAANPRLAWMLHGVWQNALEPALWDRVVAARESHGSVA